MTRPHPDPSASVAVDRAPRLPPARTPDAGPPRTPGAGPATGLHVEICRDAEAFAALAGEWDALYRRCGDTVTAFQSHAWLHSWWTSYGRRGRLRVVLVRRGGSAREDGGSGDGGGGGSPGGGGEAGERGELVAAAPLMRTYRPLPVLVALGGAITDYTDVLVAPADAPGSRRTGITDTTCGAHAGDPASPEPAGPAPANPRDEPATHEPPAREPDGDILDALAAGLRRAARGGAVDLREVRPGGGAERLYARWRGPKRQLADSVCLELPGAPMDGLIARVGSSRGQRVRKELRALDRAGLAGYDVAPADVPRAVATMLRLHLAQWRGRGMTPEHRRPRFAAHLTRAATRLVASGDAAVTEYRRGGPDGEVVAAGLTVLSPGLAGGYLYGADPALRAAKVDLMTMLIRQGAAHAADGGRPVLSLLRGAEPHKFHWRPEHRANLRLLLAGRLAAPALPLLLAPARIRAAAARSPRLRALRDRLRNALRERHA